METSKGKDGYGRTCDRNYKRHNVISACPCPRERPIECVEIHYRIENLQSVLQK